MQEGHTAITLLVNYYYEHDDKLLGFLKLAVKQNKERPYLLDMV